MWYLYHNWVVEDACDLQTLYHLLSTYCPSTVHLPSTLYTPLSVLLSLCYFIPLYLLNCINSESGLTTNSYITTNNWQAITSLSAKIWNMLHFWKSKMNSWRIIVYFYLLRGDVGDSSSSGTCKKIFLFSPP